ncbi:peptidoglycan/LPS O-acetylase OafA/YrhL [Nonlabens dokdonensis]|uniref:Acyltransferase n=2 Tax=Nonlabens dokdonensis TaxID=328515 RepID=L7WG53_NONDD|nr:acyltransferase [Nonlabens dokdonensis]AGC77888.1 acyltransferase [Nonlabens dokdonensis DSW-6]PZX36676.1 peptidoglycan/LPS O-acetylase OafA/YrhL [Nonlabens dokdonensis]
MGKTRRHFHTFDALRFFSFLLVFLHHIPVPSSHYASFFSKSGGVGVIFFFVLSGFLITYILLEEKSKTGKILLQKFFMRRVLRIWPLFYGMILFAFLTPYILEFFQLPFSNEGYEPNWLMSLFFLENYQMMMTNSFPNVSPLRLMWTLCIEEHFYILWGIIMYYIPIKKVPHLILGSIITASVFRIVYQHLGLPTLDLLTNLDYFAFGAIPAFLWIEKRQIINILSSIPISIKYGIAVAILALSFLLPNVSYAPLYYVAPILYGISFTSLILFTLCHKNEIKIPDNYWISKLGIFTYGLYLFHIIIVNLLLKLLDQLELGFSWHLFSIVALICTILLSMTSYYAFEKPFLRLKKYFY